MTYSRIPKKRKKLFLTKIDFNLVINIIISSLFALIIVYMTNKSNEKYHHMSKYDYDIKVLIESLNNYKLLYLHNNYNYIKSSKFNKDAITKLDNLKKAHELIIRNPFIDILFKQSLDFYMKEEENRLEQYLDIHSILDKALQCYSDAIVNVFDKYKGEHGNFVTLSEQITQLKYTKHSLDITGQKELYSMIDHFYTLAENQLQRIKDLNEISNSFAINGRLSISKYNNFMNNLDSVKVIPEYQVDSLFFFTFIDDTNCSDIINLEIYLDR